MRACFSAPWVSATLAAVRWTAIAVGTDQTSWAFTPASPWRAVPHSLVVLTLLEDPAGNKVGQAFEFEMFQAPKSPETERVTLSFRPRYTPVPPQGGFRDSM